MKEHRVRVHPSSDRLPREEQLAWKIAEVAAGAGALDADVLEMIACRIVDNAGVALAAINREPVAAARAMALAHPRPGGATLFGLPSETRVHAEWAAWANATAVRELDFHDTFLAADYAHPGDSIQPILAVAQQTGRSGADLARAIAVAYEIHVALVKAISLHQFKKDHVAHLAPATTAGIGALLGLPVATIFQAVNLAVHLAFSTRQSRKGEISSWKAYVPGFSGKLAIEAVDRAMRGEAAPSPIYEGEDSVIAWMLGGPASSYTVRLPAPGERLRGIMETYTKAHSAEYQAQALIDLAIELSPRIADFDAVEEIVVETSHHTHYRDRHGLQRPAKIRSGGEPRDARPFDHVHPRRGAGGPALAPRSLLRARAGAAGRRRSRCGRKIRTVEDPVWTARYHEPDPARRAFGGRISVRMKDGSIVAGEKAAADAHPNGARPWGWDDYVGKFEGLAADMMPEAERQAFLSAAKRVAELAGGRARCAGAGARRGAGRA